MLVPHTCPLAGVPVTGVFRAVLADVGTASRRRGMGIEAHPWRAAGLVSAQPALINSLPPHFPTSRAGQLAGDFMLTLRDLDLAACRWPAWPLLQ